jgi:hypothetical protein
MRFPVLAVLLLCAVASAEDKSAKKLIEFGWDEPDPAFMRGNIREMEKSPFDGTVFHVMYTRPNGGEANFTWECWGTRAFTDAELATAVEDLKSTDFRRFTHNFLRFNTTPAKLDWFDDHSAVVNNARLAARVAREGKAKGILFDIEQYEGQLFNYRKQRDAKTKSWDVYAAQVRLRGREVMTAFQEGYPDLTVFLTFGYSLPWRQSKERKDGLPDADYGLLSPFVDGLFDAARGKTVIVDGHELSYSYRSPERFDKADKAMREDVLAIAADAGQYRRHRSIGFGIWMDNDHHRMGWHVDDFTENYFLPDQLEQSVARAWRLADEYVWIYTEKPRWWGKNGKELLPSAYENAVRRGRGLPPLE